MPRPTQDECRRRYVVALDKFARELRLIDDETPASPTMEPEWWRNLMADIRHADKRLKALQF